MARAKHREKIIQREFESFVRRTERAKDHEDMLKEHKAFKKKLVGVLEEAAKTE